MENGKCVDEEGHEYDFIGYMVVAEKLLEPEKTTPVFPPLAPGVTSSTIRFGPGALMEVPSHFAAKIEVHQCKKCGNIKLAPAVYTRILAGDKEEGKK